MVTIEQKRKEVGQQFYAHAAELMASPRRGADFHGGVPFALRSAELVLGLRVCIVRVDVGFDGTRLLKKLDKATLPHLIPWKCTRQPVAYSDGRYIVMEATWPPGLERDDIQLRDIRCPGSLSGDVIVIGQNQANTTITLPACELEHVLVAGQTGSGKSFTMRSMAAQLSQPGRRPEFPRNRLVLVDGKRGGGLGIVNGLPGQVGPIATNTQTAIDALGWCYNEMNARYTQKAQAGGGKLNWLTPHLFVLIDEFQEWTLDSSSPVITSLMNKLATQGRGANVHLIAGTQKPVVGVFGKKGVGSTTSDQFSAVIGQRVKSWDTSRVVMGGSIPRCDLLLDKGDSHVVVTTPEQIMERVQVAYISEADLQRLAGGQPDFIEWRAFNASSLSGDRPAVGRRAKVTSAKELAIGIEAVIKGWGRPEYRKQFNKPPGADRWRNTILPMCKEIVEIMASRGVTVNG